VYIKAKKTYFNPFFLVQVVMTVIVAFILEAFMFRMQYMRQMKLGDMDGKATCFIFLGLQDRPPENDGWLVRKTSKMKL
jgi:hypothetical protein